jgi:drug/metabolite transporter (DMT)-like permease
MDKILPYLVCVLGSICYGFASILQQVGVKKNKHISSINPKFLLSLIKHNKYLFGLFLDLIGWLLFLSALRSLPLFLVQSFMALAIIVSAVLDHYWLKHKIIKSEKISIALVLIGIIILGLVAKPGSAPSTTEVLRWFIIAGPILVAILATIFIKIKSKQLSNTLIPILVGVSFGGTSIATRIIVFNQIDKQISQTLLVASLIIYGLIGLILLSIALQRERINRVNSLVLSSEVIFPSLLGIIFLGDGIKNKLGPLVAIGLVLVVIGTLVTSSIAKTE